MADVVRSTVEEVLNVKIDLTIKHIQDYGNYKVSVQRATNILSFKPQHDVSSIVRNLLEHRAEFADMDNSRYYNIFNNNCDSL